MSEIKTNWWESLAERFHFARILIGLDLLQDAGSVVDFMEKPYNWEKEYAIWFDLNKPEEGGDNWNEFYIEIDKLIDA